MHAIHDLPGCNKGMEPTHRSLDPEVARREQRIEVVRRIETAQGELAEATAALVALDEAGVVLRAPSTGGADGRWHGSVDMGWRPDGRRHRRHVSAKTKTAVAAKLSVLRAERSHGVTGGGANLTVGAFFDAWLERAAQG